MTTTPIDRHGEQSSADQGRRLDPQGPRGAAPAALTPVQARARFRSGTVAPTAGWAAGFAQANLISVPQDYKSDVLLFAQRNPKPCPVLDVTEPGAWKTAVALGADLRVDLPLYRVWQDGRLVQEPADVTHVWRDDLVTFVIGCSFTFEAALLEAGVPVRHLEQGINVPMFQTNRPCRAAGRLHGDLVVTMRPMPVDQVATAVHLTALVPAVHGAPVHIGDPSALGIADLDKPEYGDPVQLHQGDVPVFWACGVTLQAAIMASRPPFAITHAPGHMLVTDVRDADLRGA
jgi:uncharacterized protein YcsI (UPF0317 family)